MSKIATRESYGNAVTELGKENPNIVVLDADLAGATKSGVFKKAFPERHFNAGIAETDMVCLAAGLSLAGKIPFVSTFAVFGTGRAYDAVRNAVCYPKLNVKLALTHAGLTVGEDGATHQMLEDIALMNALPNMTVIVPADDTEAKQVVKAAVEIDGPVFMRFARAATPVVFGDDYKFEIGKAATIKEGNDVTLIACGIMVQKALEAADELAKEGINARVINMATIKPLDKDAVIKAAKETGAIVTCEEHSIYGGLGSVVSQALSNECPVPMEYVAVKDTFGESGTPDALLAKYHIDTPDIIEAAKKAVGRK
ncbi:transketolase family protein [Anaerofustis stercorihominis]|uniref:transketolase family protein n=1 Tax=Anaerofustis stercorihominis TaxID=214853 RepID=UPI0011063733|nr:transketolase family protein [Anaerofustis stercorihominis]